MMRRMSMLRAVGLIVSAGLVNACTPAAAPPAATSKPAQSAPAPTSKPAQSAPAAASPPAAPPKASPAAGASPAAKAAASPAAAASATEPRPIGPKFQALLDKAKQSDGRLRGGLASVGTETQRAWEAAFEKQFGIKIQLESEPGHGSREIPPKMVTAQKAGKGLVDWIEGGNPSNFAPLMEAGNLQRPNWDALEEQWPEIKDLRKLYPDVPGGPSGTTLQDYCMLNSQVVWSLVINTRNVKDDEVRNLKYDTLLGPNWKDRVGWDAQALGFKEMPFREGWPQERVTAYAHNLGANGVKLVSGGTNGVLQSLSQGEVDISMTNMETAYSQMSKGAPLKFAWPEFGMGNDLGICIPAITANNAELAQIWFAWRNVQGEWIDAETGGGGARPFYAPEAARYPLGKIIKEGGWTEANLARPQKLEDYKVIEKQRAAAIEALKAGIQTKAAVPYPWGGS